MTFLVPAMAEEIRNVSPPLYQAPPDATPQLFYVYDQKPLAGIPAR